MELDLQPDNSGPEVVLLMTSHSPNTHTYIHQEKEKKEKRERSTSWTLVTVL